MPKKQSLGRATVGDGVPLLLNPALQFFSCPQRGMGHTGALDMTSHQLGRIQVWRIARPATQRALVRRAGALMPAGLLTNHQRLSPLGPGLAVNGIGAKARFVPEQHLGATGLGLGGHSGKGLMLAARHGIRIARIGALQRLLRCQSQARQQRADGCQAEPDMKAPEQELLHELALQQPQVKAVLLGALAALTYQ